MLRMVPPKAEFSVTEATERQIAELKAYYGVTSTTAVLKAALADLRAARGRVPQHLRQGPKLRLVPPSPPPEPEVGEPRT